MTSPVGDPSLHSAQRIHTWAGVALVAACALLYWLTLDTGLQSGELHGGDLITHQYAQVQARPSNAPGYPLYTMLGWAWFHSVRGLLQALGNPLPNPVAILGAFSTIWALLAVWLLYQCALHLTSTRYWRGRTVAGLRPQGNWLLAWLVAAFYAVTYFFWYYATTTEQYTSAVAQTLAIFYVWLLWSARDAEAADDAAALRATPLRLLVLLAFLCGLSLAHMLTVAFIVPPLVVAVLWQRPALLRSARVVGSVVVAALAPLLAYLYVYVRGAQHPEWWGSQTYANAAEWFWSFVRTSQGFEELAWGLEAGRPFWGGGLPAMIWQELSLPLLALGIIGVALLRRRERLILFGTFAIYFVFCWLYRFGNWYQVIMPVYPLLLLGVVVAVARFLRWSPLQEHRWLRAIPYALLLIAILWRADASLPMTDSRKRIVDTALDRAALLLATAPANSALFAAVDEILALDYLISIWGVDAGSLLVRSDNADAAARVRPLYATWDAAPTLLAEIDGEDWRLRTQSPDWVEFVQGASRADFAMAANLDEPIALLDGALHLVDYAIASAPSGEPVLRAPAALDLLLHWQVPDGVWPVDVAVSVRPRVDGAWITLATGEISQQDAAAPMRGLAAHALDATRFADAYRLPLNERLPAGADEVLLLLYDSASGVVLDEVHLPL